MFGKQNIKNTVGWNRLDNAAKIFPPTSSQRNTRVFRFSCELFEEILPDILQNAVEWALNTFPYYSCVMKKGVFWYYLEESDLSPIVKKESKMPCSSIYDKDRPKLLFEVSYYKRRINLEIFHVLSDGTGAMQFLKTIIAKYLLLKHPTKISGGLSELDYPASQNQKISDSFRKYYKKNIKTKRLKPDKAFHLSGFKRDPEQLQVIEGIVSVKKLIEISKIYNTTLTVFLTAIYIQAIREEISISMENRPVVLMIPVNLRHYFPSETVRNFFGMIRVEYDFSKQGDSFQDILTSVNKNFKTELTKEKLSTRMNALSALEHNPFAKIAPLPFKNFVMNIARSFSEAKETAVISNIGIVKMPDELKDYVDKFSVSTSTTKLQLCLCSYNDKLSLSFSSYFISTDIQMRFFRYISNLGVNIEIRSNDCFLKNEIRKD